LKTLLFVVRIFEPHDCQQFTSAECCYGKATVGYLGHVKYPLYLFNFNQI